MARSDLLPNLMRSGITDNARTLLGGDFELSSLHLPPNEELLAEVSAQAETSQIIQMRAMLGTAVAGTSGSARKLVELKAVDEAYPLVGEISLNPAQSLAAALDGLGAVVDPACCRQLAYLSGDTASLGNITVTITATLDSEPDQAISFVSFGPRLVVSTATLTASGLKQEGAFITYRHRAVMREAGQLDQLTDQLAEAVENSHVRLRKTDAAAGGFERFIEQRRAVFNAGQSDCLIDWRAGGQRSSAGLAAEPDDGDRHTEMCRGHLTPDFSGLYAAGSGHGQLRHRRRSCSGWADPVSDR